MPIHVDVVEAVNKAFSPHFPIREVEAFKGRDFEKDRVEEAILSDGLHVLIYGERGTGKSSIANVCASQHKRVEVPCSKANFAQICKHIIDQLQERNLGEFVFDAASDLVTYEGRQFRISELTANDLRLMLPREGRFCIVLDELDQMENLQARYDVAQLCKTLSTYHPNVTMLMVGVAETADELLKGHTSNNRNIRHVRLGRMKTEDLQEILRRGEELLEIRFDSFVEGRILAVCDKFPHYVHLLAQHSAKHALLRGSPIVSREDYDKALKSAALDSDQKLKEDYETAVASVQGSQLYRQILWVMAEIEDAQISVGTIAEKVRVLARYEGGQEVTVQAVGSAVRTLTQPKRRSVLVNKGNGHYRFSDPLIRGYIRMVRENVDAE